MQGFHLHKNTLVLSLIIMSHTKNWVWLDQELASKMSLKSWSNWEREWSRIFRRSPEAPKFRQGPSVQLYRSLELKWFDNYGHPREAADAWKSPLDQQESLQVWSEAQTGGTMFAWLVLKDFLWSQHVMYLSMNSAKGVSSWKCESTDSVSLRSDQMESHEADASVLHL